MNSRAVDMRMAKICVCLATVMFLCGCAVNQTPVSDHMMPALTVRYPNGGVFNQSVNNPRVYEHPEGVQIKAGVIPHHATGAALISGFFKLAAVNAEEYDTVVIIAPNHKGGLGDVVVSRRDWDTGGGIRCDTDIIDALLDTRVSGIRIVENDERMETDHSASVLIPYIDYYLPKANVAPILLSRTLSLDNTYHFAEVLAQIIAGSGKRALVVCSIDFSHYLTPDEAMRNDLITIDAIREQNYVKIHELSNEYVDSPATLIVFLRYLSGLSIEAQFVDHTDASEFLGYGIQETTTYFTLIGYGE